MSINFFGEPQISHVPSWFFYPQQNDPHKMMEEISPFHSLFHEEFNTIPQLQYEESNKLSSYLNEFDDLENFNFDFNLLPPLDDEHFEVDQNPLKILIPEPSLKTESTNNGFVVASVRKEFEVDQEMQLALMTLSPSLPSENKMKKKKKKRSSNALELEFDEINKYFDVPITVAANKMNVGLTHLKKRCRELNITRWPHRKLKSLNLLINSLKEVGLAKEVVMLEKEKKMLEKLPSMDLNQETKKLRQAFNKANYMRRRRFMTPLP